jgi:hypothetical protein
VTVKITEAECDDITKALARKLYESYTANSDNLNFQGNPCPAWPELPPAIRGHWCRIALETHNIAWQAWHQRSEGPYDPHSDGRARHEEAQAFATWWRTR